jgi:hypothetical protein
MTRPVQETAACVVTGSLLVAALDDLIFGAAVRNPYADSELCRHPYVVHSEHLVPTLSSYSLPGRQTFTHALYTLAANPEYIKPLREEIEAVLEDEGGVTKVAMTNMYKLE